MTDAWAAHYATPAGMRYWPCEELVRFVAGRRLGRVLEVGCGNGANLWFLAEQADFVTGIDSSRQALEMARTYVGRRRMSAPVEFLQGDALSLEYAGEFDLVVDCMVSQHMPWNAHKLAYAEYRRVLKPDGQLFLYHLDARTDCDRSGVRGWDIEHLSLFPEVGLTCLPMAATLALVLEQCGFAHIERRGLLREYLNGDVASYAVITARAS